MTLDIGLTLGIILIAMILFATEKLRVDLVALLVLLAVAVTGLVSKEEVFSGFANPCIKRSMSHTLNGSSRTG